MMITKVSSFYPEMNWGDPQIFWSFTSPHKTYFIAFLRKNFRKFSKFGVLCPGIFFEKFPKIFEKFPEIFLLFPKLKKSIDFEHKLVQNHYIDQNQAKFSHKTTKTGRFFLKNVYFSKFSAPSKFVKILEFYVT